MQQTKFYSIKEIVNLLNISPKTCYNNYLIWRKEGRIETILRIGNRIRIPACDVKRLVKSFEVEAAEIDK